MKILDFGRCALSFCAAFAILSGCGNGSSQISPSRPSEPAADAVTSKDVIYAFKGGPDGAEPYAGLLVENGELFGTTGVGGNVSVCGTPSGQKGCGTVFELSSSGSKNILYSFQGGSDGNDPQGGLTSGKGGVLYGVTDYGGGATPCTPGCGTVFELSPSGSGYTERVIDAFQGGNDGELPIGNLLADNGALYGTTNFGGGAAACTAPSSAFAGCGTVFKLTPSGSGFTESVLYRFQGGADGALPDGTLIADSTGALYGTTQYGGGTKACTAPYPGCGTVFKLTPSGSTYTETILYRFKGGSKDGSNPRSALLAGKKGVLYGATRTGGASNDGTVYQLTPVARRYTERVLHAFDGTDGANPRFENALYADASGSIYGTTQSGGLGKCSGGCGTVFKLTPSGSGYTEGVLYSFKGSRQGDGSYPQASVIAHGGVLYGTTCCGGIRPGWGTVFKLSP